MSNAETNGAVDLNTGLTPEEVDELLADSRAKNVYAPKTQLFADSTEAGIDPAKEWPVEFGKKQASTLYQGFLGAVKKLEMEDRIQVLRRGERVVLIDKSKVTVKTEA